MTNDLKIMRYLEKGFTSRSGKILSLIGNPYSFYLAKKLYASHSPTDTIISPVGINITVPAYQGKNACALAIQKVLSSTNHPCIKAAIVHGSIGDENEIPYSDFDGILLIDTAALENAKQLYSLRALIKKTEALFLAQDALQHHGWTLLTTDDLSFFKDHQHPLHLLEYGKVVFPSNSFTFRATVSSEKSQYAYFLKNLCASILRKCQTLTDFKNQYLFKNLLSEIMLLPAAFIQSQKGASVLKKESFEKFKKEYPEINFDLIDEVSALRRSWEQQPVSRKTRWFHTLKELGILVSFLVPKTPDHLLQKVDTAFKRRVIDFCEMLLKKSNQSKG